MRSNAVKIRDLIGEESFERLRRYAGGRRVYIPHPDLPHRRHQYRLLKLGILNREEIRRLADEFGGGLRLRVPIR